MLHDELPGGATHGQASAGGKRIGHHEAVHHVADSIYEATSDVIKGTDGKPLTQEQFRAQFVDDYKKTLITGLES